MQRRLFKIIMLSSFILLGACAQNPQPLGKPMPTLTYTHLMPYKVQGGSVKVMQSAVIDAASDAAMQGFIMRPDTLLNRYAKARFMGVEQDYSLPQKAVFNIEQLSLVKKSDEQNIVGILSGAAVDYYTLNVFVSLTPMAENGRVMKPYTIKLKRELLVPERSSLAEREMLEFEFLEKMIDDIDAKITVFMDDLQ